MKDYKHKREKTERAAVLAAAAFVCIMYILGPLKAQSAENVRNDYEGIIRFHVIANSDSKEDQALKLHVRNMVVMKLQNALAFSTDVEETREYIQANLGLIEDWAESSIRGWGSDYDVSACLGISPIPARQYDDLYFPAGNYEALTITIGEGKGQNWWCVVFPPLCLVDAGDEAYGELFEKGETGLVLRSKIKELLERRRKS